MLTKVHDFIQASELRKNLSRYLKDAKKKPVIVSTDRGGSSRVIIDVSLYNKLVETYENYQDTRELMRLIKKDDGKRVPWESVRQHALQR